MFGMPLQSSKNPHELKWDMMNIYCIFTIAFCRVLWYSFLTLPQSLVLEYVHGHNRLIFVAPNIKNGLPCNYKCFLHTSDVPCLLDWFFPLTLESLSFVLLFPSSRSYIATSFFLSTFGPMVMLFFFGPARLSVLPSAFRQHNISSLPLPRPSNCLNPHSWADISFSKDILHSAGEFSSGWQIIQKYFKTRVREEVWGEFSLKIPETPRKSQHDRIYQFLEKCKDVQMVS